MAPVFTEKTEILGNVGGPPLEVLSQGGSIYRVFQLV